MFCFPALLCSDGMKAKKKKKLKQTQNSNLQKLKHLLDMGNKKTLGPMTEGVAWGSHVVAL